MAGAPGAGEVDATVDGRAASRSRSTVRHRFPLWLRVSLTVVVLAAAVWFLVRPQFADMESSLEAMESISIPLILIAFGLQAASIAAYSALTGLVLGWGRLRYSTLLRIDLTDLAINHTTPGGGAVAGAARYGLLVGEGIGPESAIAAATVEVGISNLALVVVFLSGVTLSLGQLDAGSGAYLVAGVAGVVMLALVIAAGWLLLTRTDSAIEAARRVGRRIPLLGAARAARFVESFAEDVRLVVRDRRTLVLASLCGLANWLLDAATLWVVLAPLGDPLAVGPLLAVYGLGSIISQLPITPGGLGLVEGVMVPALLGFGVAHSPALLGVFGWRLLEYWLPIPAGGIAYATLRVGRLRRERVARADAADGARKRADRR